MNLYPLPANKVALRLLNGLEYTRGTIEFLTYCCDFHGCGNYNFHKNCVALFKAGGIPLMDIAITVCDYFRSSVKS